MTNLISKILTFVVLLVTLVLPANPNNAPVTVKEVTTQSEYISYTYTNRTNKTIDSSSWVSAFEKNVDGEWIPVKFCQAIPEVAYSVFPGKTDSASFDVEENLTIGQYKLTVSYNYKTFANNEKHFETATGSSSVIFEVTE